MRDVVTLFMDKQVLTPKEIKNRREEKDKKKKKKEKKGSPIASMPVLGQLVTNLIKKDA